MPRLPDDPVQDEEHGTFEAFEDYRHRAWDGAYSFWQSFLDFALRDNVLEVAVGLMCVSLPSLQLQLHQLLVAATLLSALILLAHQFTTNRDYLGNSKD
jgi:hypothetical protein